MTNLHNLYEFILLFDILDGNPNGDPDANNLPRIDSETGRGIVTDTCLKRKIRNRIQVALKGKPGGNIFICEHRDSLFENATPSLPVKAKKPTLAQTLCAKFYDVRAFGCVLPKRKGVNNGQIRGPIQFSFARSIDTVLTQEHSIHRIAVATKAESKKQKGENHTIPRKNTISYGLYRVEGYIIPAFAEKTGFSETDLADFWHALWLMFSEDPSASHGLMSTRKLIVFKHESALGNAQASELFHRVKVMRKDMSRPAEAFNEYNISIDKTDFPSGVTCLTEVELFA